MFDIRVIAILIAFAGTFGAGWYFGSLKADLAILTAENEGNKKALEITSDLNKIAAGFEDYKGVKQTATRVVVKERIRDAKDSSFGCRVNADGVRLLEDTRRASDPGKPNK